MPRRGWLRGEVPRPAEPQLREGGHQRSAARRDPAARRSPAARRNPAARSNPAARAATPSARRNPARAQQPRPRAATPQRAATPPAHTNPTRALATPPRVSNPAARSNPAAYSKLTIREERLTGGAESWARYRRHTPRGGVAGKSSLPTKVGGGGDLSGERVRGEPVAARESVAIQLTVVD